MDFKNTFKKAFKIVTSPNFVAALGVAVAAAQLCGAVENMLAARKQNKDK
jgi:hypothetical protein